MNTDKLAPVFLDNQPISLKDPRPKVSAVLSASGKPEATEVKWLQFQPNTQGKSLRSEEVLDRTSDPSKPIYLTSTAKGQATSFGAKGNEAAIGLAPTGSEPTKAGHKAGVNVPVKIAEDADSEGMQSDADLKGEKHEEKADDE